MRVSLHPGVWSNTLSLSLAGGGALTVATATEAGLRHLGEFGIVAGLGLFLWGIRIDGKPWWQRWKRPVLYISHVRELLPTEGPRYPFYLYSILESNPADALYYGWSEHNGPIPWGWPERPWAQRIEVTNHGDDTLVNVVVGIELKPILSADKPPVKGSEIAARFDQIRAGETTVAFIANDSPVMAIGHPISAIGTTIGGNPRELRFHAKPAPPGMMLAPAPRFQTVTQPEETEATSQRHKEILQALAPLLARVSELAMVYGQRDLDSFTAAKEEAHILVAEIPYDEGTARTVRDFLNYCDRLIGDWLDHSDERENRQLVHRVSVGLFRYLHEGKPVDRSKIELAEDAAE